MCELKMESLLQFKDDYLNPDVRFPVNPYHGYDHECFQNQSPYDLIANYTPSQQKTLITFCERFIPIKSRKLSTYALKDWVEHYLDIGYVSTGAMKGALLLNGFSLAPNEFNARVNISANAISKSY